MSDVLTGPEGLFYVQRIGAPSRPELWFKCACGHCQHVCRVTTGATIGEMAKGLTGGVIQCDKCHKETTS